VPEPLSPAERVEFERLWNSHPGMRHMGARVDLSVPGAVRCVVDPVLPGHRGGLGTEAVNGAVIAGVFDLVIGLSGYLHTHGRRAGVAQLSIQFLRPVLGSRFEAVARPTRAGINLVFSTAELYDERGAVCARCDGIVAVAGTDRGEKPPEMML
jgi:acyl-coenzyme A thioesterase PaaI-like protein